MRSRIVGQVCLLGVAAAALVVAWVSTGSSPGLVSWWLAVVLFGVLLPGWVLTRCLRSGPVSATDLGWAGPAGLVLALATWLVGHLVGHSLPTLVVGPLVAVVLLAVPATRRRVLLTAASGGGRTPWPAWAALALVLLAAVRWMWVMGLSKTAPQPTARFQLYYQDLLYQAALTGEARRSLVPGYPMVNGEPLGYHWFFHALAAQLSGTGLDDLDVVTRLLPSVLVVMLVLLAAAVGRQVTGHWSGGLGAAAGVALVRPVPSDVWTEGGLSPVPGYWEVSPTALLGWVFGLALVGCLIAVLRRSSDDSWAPAALLPFFAAGAAGAKSAQLPVIVGGVALAGLAALVLEWRHRRAAPGALKGLVLRYAVCLGVLVVIMVLAVLVIYPGSYGLRLDPGAWPAAQSSLVYGHQVTDPGAETTAVLVSLLRRWVPTVLPALGLLVLLRRRPGDPAGWIGAGTVLAGVLAAMAFTHPSASQYYFTMAALPIGYALSGAGVAELVRTGLAPRAESDRTPFARVRGRVLLLLGLAAAGLVTVAVVRRVLPSSGRRPRNLTGLTGTTEIAQTWLAPTLTTLGVLVLVVTLVWLVGRRSPDVLHRGTWAALLVVAAVGAGGFAVLQSLAPLSDPGTPRSASPATDRAKRPAISPALFQAGQYLRSHASPSDIVATNRVWSGLSPAGRPDNRDFSVSALSGLRTDVGGYGYAPRLLEGLQPGVPYTVAPFWDQPRLDAELALVRNPTPAGLEAAYRTQGVRWIVADERSGPVSPDLARLTDVVSRVDGVWLARLRPGGA